MKLIKRVFKFLVLGAFLDLLVKLFLINVANASKKPLKVVSLAPSLTEIVFALGSGSELVGVTTECNYPVDALRKGTIGSYAHPNLEKILALKPDLVLATEGNDSAVLVQLKRLGKDVLYTNAASVEQVGSEFLKIGKALGKSPIAEKWVSSFAKQLVNAALVNEKSEKKRALILLELDPTIGVGPQTWLGSLFKAAGFDNPLLNNPAPYPVLEKEVLLQMNPDWVFFEKRFAEKQVRKKLELKANVRLFAMDSDVFLRPGPRIAEAFGQLLSLPVLKKP